MSFIKIKDLPEKIDNAKDEDVLVIEDSEDTKKIPLIKLKAAFSMDSILTSIKDMLLERINIFISMHNDRFNELNDSNRQLEVTCNNLENDHIHDADRVAALENRLVDQTSLVSNLQFENARLISGLNVVETDRNNLLIKTQDLEQKLSDRESSIYFLTMEFERLQRSYDNLKEENENIKNRVTELETTYNTTIDEFVNTSNEEIQTKLNELMAYIRYYHPNVDEEV